MTKMRKSDPGYFKRYYLHQAEQKRGRLDAFHGARVQRGFGLGSFLKGLYRWAVPHLSTGIKTVGQHALREGVGVASDVVNGESLRDSLVKRGKKAIGSLASQNAPKAQKGGGKKTTKRKAQAKSTTRPVAKKQKTSPPKKTSYNTFFD